MAVVELIEAYAEGPTALRDAVNRAPEVIWDATPIAGSWSIRQVVCHLADAEIIYADRMKRVLAEEEPTLFEADPNDFVPSLHFRKRDLQTEVRVIEAIRVHMLPILQSCAEDDFLRIGVHSLDGPMTLSTLLQRITGHIPHHVAFIEAKLLALGT